MASVNIRQLRDTRKLKAYLRSGKTVELRERNRVIARIVPARREPRPVSYPDFAARRKKTFGSRKVPATRILIEERGRY
jgi:antitoxin (DNA-binding transcriptional repressor) of toxin-antitoxin stability system